ncbi:MAG: epoxyqueuosine reductase QueH [Lachnospiraceae bacterium]|jgi:predicted adenine nucleotide alpha hydrolase (AANH) superfamily ATPase|nr:epoxyqueuosine reductase QueH [Lachnospiraceae bacterium]
MNYFLECQKTIEAYGARPGAKRPRLLLHACCAPCSSACLEFLREYFDTDVFYYDPNITDAAEYGKRKAEELRLIEAYNRQVESGCFSEGGFAMHSTAGAARIGFLEAPYDPESFFAAAKGLEDCPEGGERCSACFALRLGKTAEAAARGGYDFFTTTLTISPLKDADRLNRIGQATAEKYGTAFLPSDFKKKNGYLRSIELSRQFGLYRQNYCGCGFSKKGRENQA